MVNAPRVKGNSARKSQKKRSLGPRYCWPIFPAFSAIISQYSNLEVFTRTICLEIKKI